MSNPDPLESLAFRSRRTLDLLIKRGFVPSTAMAFDITDNMLKKSIEIYGELGTGNGKFSYGFARKLHGMNLLMLKFSRGATLRDCREGMVYLIANPCWPDYLKIGMTMDINSRLKSYQTYDPFQRFYVKNYEFCIDRRAAEKELLEKFEVHLAGGEWIKHKHSLRVISTLRKY